MKDRYEDFYAIFAHLVYPEACDPLTLDDAVNDVNRFIEQKIRGENLFAGGPNIQGGTIWGVSEGGIQRIEHCLLMQIGWHTDQSILMEWNGYSGGNGCAMYITHEEALAVKRKMIDLVNGV